MGEKRKERQEQKMWDKFHKRHAIIIGHKHIQKPEVRIGGIGYKYEQSLKKQLEGNYHLSI